MQISDKCSWPWWLAFATTCAQDQLYFFYRLDSLQCRLECKWLYLHRFQWIYADLYQLTGSVWFLFPFTYFSFMPWYNSTGVILNLYWQMWKEIQITEDGQRMREKAGKAFSKSISLSFYRMILFSQANLCDCFLGHACKMLFSNACVCASYKSTKGKENINLKWYCLIFLNT